MKAQDDGDDREGQEEEEDEDDEDDEDDDFVSSRNCELVYTERLLRSFGNIIALSMISANSSSVSAGDCPLNMASFTTGGPRITAQVKADALPSRSSSRDINLSLDTSLLVWEESSASRRSICFISSDVSASIK